MIPVLRKRITNILTVLVFFQFFLDNVVAQSSANISFENEIQPLLKDYCYSCHGEGEKLRGDLDLTPYSNKHSLFKDRKIWIEILHQIETEEMPTKKPFPTNAERQKLVKYLNDQLNSVDWSKIKHAGHVTLPRLNKREYKNTMRDLLGIDLDSGHLLSADGEGQSGFTTDRDSLFMSPAEMEKYYHAAERAIESLVYNQKPIQMKVEAEDMFAIEGGNITKSAGFKGRYLRLDKNTVFDSIDIPVDGYYDIELRAAPFKLTNVITQLRVDNDLKGDFTHVEEKPAVQKISCFLAKGARQFSWNLGSFKPDGSPVTRIDDSITLDWMKISGPKHLDGPIDKKLVFHTGPSSKVTPDKAAHGVITRFVQRAARQPLSGEVANRYYEIYKTSLAGGSDYADSLKLALSAVLISPHFLYRNEFSTSGKEIPEGEDYALDDHQIASKLSYFLWLTMPDKELFILAAEGKLKDPVVLRAQVKRMLADPKAREFTSAFLGQWLGYESVGRDIIPDKEIFPEFNERLAEAMKLETVLTFEHLIAKNHSLLTLLDTKATFLNEQLANLYGVTGVTGVNMRPYLLKDKSRGGLLGMASILTATSSATRTSPVLRGKWVMETLLGERVPEPPADVPELADKAGMNEKMTLREELEIHRNNKQCASCHDKLDPIGFGLENFDAIGRFRREEFKGQPIDSSGELDGFKFSGSAELKGWLIKQRKEQFIRNLSEKMLAFALGRELHTFDEAPLIKITKALKENNYTASLLIEETVLSYPFLHQSNSNQIKENE